MSTLSDVEITIIAVAVIVLIVMFLVWVVTSHNTMEMVNVKHDVKSVKLIEDYYETELAKITDSRDAYKHKYETIKKRAKAKGVDVKVLPKRKYKPRNNKFMLNNQEF